MIKYIFITLLTTLLYSENLVDCNQIFEQRKDEMLREMDKLDAKQEEFELYREAKMKILKKKEESFLEREEEIKKQLERAKKLKQEAEDLKKQNEQILKNIKEAKADKISKTYMKMKDSKAAAIFNTMDEKDSARILFGLKASKISKIMAKMDPQKAATVTKLLEDNKAFVK